MNSQDAGGFVFIEVGHGYPDGGFTRNEIVRHDEYVPNGLADVFTSYMLFTDELERYAKANPNEYGNPSVKDYAGPALPQKIVADFDNRANLEQARKNALHFVRRAAHKFEIPEGYFRVCFSGNKGFSVEVPSEAFGGFEPHPLAAAHVGYIARKLAGGVNFPSFDDSIYDAVTRLWRVPNTRHGESGLYKIELSLDELASLSIEEIKELAKQPRPLREKPDIQPVPALVELYAEARGRASSSGQGKKERKASPDEDGLIREGKGRNNALTSHAGWLRREGYAEEAIFTALTALNSIACDPPLEEEVRKIAGSVSRYEPRSDPEDGAGEKPAEEEGRRPQADRLVAYAREDLQELFTDQTGAPHALVRGRPCP